MKRAANLDILLVEPDASDMFLLKEMIRETCPDVNHLYERKDLTEACKFLQVNDVDLIILDISLPGDHGLKSFIDISHASTKTPVIVLTGLFDKRVAMQAISAGASDYLVKGEFNEELLARAIQYGIQRKKQVEKLKESESKYKQLFRINC